jgi:hypothetical protein
MKYKKYLSGENVIKILVAIGLATLLIAALFFFWQDFTLDTTSKINAEKIGQFGDFIGGISGSIWALAGVLLFYKALTEQRVDFANNRKSLDLQANALIEQIKEIQLNRKELESSRKIYTEQSRTLKIQQFESNFYSLLNIHLTIKNNLPTKDFFRKINNSVLERTQNEKIEELHNSSIEAYSHKYELERESLSHYFRSLYRLMSIIDNNTFFDEREKYFYSKIVRSQLSDFELLVLYYNSFTSQGNNLLKHLHIKDTPYIFIKGNEAELKNRLEIASSIYSQMDRFLLTYFEKFYDIDFERDKVEEYLPDIKIFMALHLNIDGKLTFKIKSETKTPARITEYNDECVKLVILAFFNFRLKFSTYLNESDLIITPSIIEYEHCKIYCIELNTDKLIRINRDED